MDVLITYDVSEKQVEVKKEMKKLGYFDSWTSDQGKTTYYLPNTTLWKKDIDTQKALADLKSVCTTLNVRLERAIAVPSTPWAGITGDKHF